MTQVLYRLIKMFIHMTVVKLAPQGVHQAIEDFSGNQPGDCSPVQGLRQWYLIESQDEPGKVIWLAIWDKMSAAQAFLSSPRYAQQVSSLRQALLAGPEWYGYSVIKHQI